MKAGQGILPLKIRTAEHHHQLVCERCYKVVKYSDFIDDERELYKKVESVLVGETRIRDKKTYCAVLRHLPGLQKGGQ